MNGTAAKRESGIPEPSRRMRSELQNQRWSLRKEDPVTDRGDGASRFETSTLQGRSAHAAGHHRKRTFFHCLLARASGQDVSRSKFDRAPQSTEFLQG